MRNLPTNVIKAEGGQTCCICGDQFFVRKGNYVDKHVTKRRKFCSRKCWLVHVRENPPGKGVKMSLERREQLSRLRTGKKLSPEHCRNISLGNKGKKRSAEARKRISEAVKGKLLGRKLSPSHRENLGKARRGEKHWNWQGGLTANQTYYKRIKRARVKGNGGKHTQVEWEALKKKHGHMCLSCKRVEPEVTLHRDHIVPVSLGGSNDISNIQPLCKSCNSKKFTKIITFK